MLPLLIPAAVSAFQAAANSPAASVPPTASGLGAFTPSFVVGSKIVGRDNSAPQTVSPTVSNTPAISTGAAPALYTDSGLPAAMAPASPLAGFSLSPGMMLAIAAAALALVVALFMPRRRKKDNDR